MSNLGDLSLLLMNELEMCWYAVEFYGMIFGPFYHIGHIRLIGCRGNIGN